MQVPLQILVVDDDMDAAESLSALFEIEGHTTQIVHNGLLVLAAASRLLPDLVVMDMELPGLDGCAVATQIRQDPTLNDTMLVALTGWGRDVDKRAAINSGFDLYLLKPASLDELRELMARALHQRRST